MIKNKGFTLIELVVYTAIVAVIFALVLTGMIGLYRSSRVARLSRTVNISAVTALERISREVRDAGTVMTASSTLNTNPGVLTIETDNASTTGGAYTFSVSSGRVQIADNTSTQFLTSSDVNVSELTFWLATSTNGEAVRVKIIAAPVASSTLPARTFYSTTVLRESYE
ncbi:MAG: type II secretion system protein [Patescibacteria group bacterium]